MAAKRDYYKILGVPHTASAAEIKRAFRSRARQIHPDINPSPDASGEFKELSQAYAVLSDPERRSVYDRVQQQPVRPFTSTYTYRTYRPFSGAAGRAWSDRARGGPAGPGAAAAPAAPGSFREALSHFIRNPAIGIILLIGLVGLNEAALALTRVGWFGTVASCFFWFVMVFLVQAGRARTAPVRDRLEPLRLFLAVVGSVLAFTVLAFAIPVALYFMGKANRTPWLPALGGPVWGLLFLWVMQRLAHLLSPVDAGNSSKNGL